MHEPDLVAFTMAVDTALAGDEDFDVLWNELGRAITAWPRNAALRRLRIRLAEVAWHRATHISDLAALRELEPDNRDVWLELALLQHRWADLLVDGEDEETTTLNDAFGEGNGVDVDSALWSDSHDSRRVALERQALQWLADLLETYREDADFCVEVFAHWAEASIYSPWLRLRLGLSAAATHPNDNRIRRVLAMAWEDLANQAPEDFDPTKPLPMGFLVDLFGNLWDPYLIERAIQGHEELLQNNPDDSDLLRRRGQLHQAMSAFAVAADDFDAAATAIERAAGALTDEEERDSLLEEGRALRDQARQCRGGREALMQESLDAMGEAMGRLLRPIPSRAGVVDEASELILEWRQSAEERMQEFASDLGTLRQQGSKVRNEPDEEQLETLRSMVAGVTASIVQGLELTPAEVRNIEPEAFESDWPAQSQAFLAAMRGMGWQSLGWIEWPNFRNLFGHQVVSSVWADPAANCVVLGSLAFGRVLVDIETELDDGRQVVSSLSRGRNFLTGGAEVNTLFVEPTLPLEEAVALHQARVACICAREAGVAPRPVNNLHDVAARQESGRQAKLRFRLKQGLTRYEALGVPNDYPDVFAPMLQQAVKQEIASLNQRRAQ